MFVFILLSARIVLFYFAGVQEKNVGTRYKPGSTTGKCTKPRTISPSSVYWAELTR